MKTQPGMKKTAKVLRFFQDFAWKKRPVGIISTLRWLEQIISDFGFRISEKTSRTPIPKSKIRNPKSGLVFPGFLVICLLVSGCARTGEQVDFATVTPDFFGFGDELAKQLVANKRNNTVTEERLILTTFVNLDDLYQTSGFGRALTESLSNSLFRQGFRVAEIRKAPGLYVKAKAGELTLTRDISLIAKNQEVQAIIAGTYSLTPKTIVVNAKMLAADSEEVLSVAGLEIERSSNINYLLSERKGLVVGPLSAYER